MKQKWFTKADLILLVCLLAIGIASPFVLHKSASENAKVCIYLADQKLIETSLDENAVYGFADGKIERISLADERGFDNVIVIDEKTVCVVDANCPGHDCVRTGKISKAGEVIACLPHRLIISIEGSSDIDVVVK